MAGIGASFFLAYVIEATWLTNRLELKDDEQANIFLGVVMGIGLCGLLAIGLSLMLSEHSSASHFSFFGRYVFWWSSVSMTFLGVLEAVQPALTFDVKRNVSRKPHKDSGKTSD